MLAARTADVVARLPSTMAVQIVSVSSPTLTLTPTKSPVAAVANVIPFLPAAGNTDADDAAIARLEAVANDILATKAISERLRSRLARIRSFLLND